MRHRRQARIPLAIRPLRPDGVALRHRPPPWGNGRLMSSATRRGSVLRRGESSASGPLALQHCAASQQSIPEPPLSTLAGQVQGRTAMADILREIARGLHRANRAMACRIQPVGANPVSIGLPGPRSFLVPVFVVALGLISTAALADYRTTITHADGSKTLIESFWSVRRSYITEFSASGEKLSEKDVPGGAGKWDVHKEFVGQYMKDGSKAKSKSPSGSPVGSFD